MQIFAKTDIGKERQVNEDFYYVAPQDSKLSIYIIADGMGGYNAGEVASKMATNAVKDFVLAQFEEHNKNREQLTELLKDAIEYANTVVYEASISKKELNGMGTTLDVCLIFNNKLYIGHIGDSRVYRIRKGFMRKITRDHSYVQTLIEDGTITKEEAYSHPKKNMLTKALGCLEKVEPDVYVKTFIEGDKVVMTTDGLTNMIREDKICNIIEDNPQEATEKLINLANENGGYDNITVIIIV